MNTLELSRWLWDFYFAATLLLGGELLACLFARQPARRNALAWATAVGLLALAFLTTLPNWSRLHLLSPAPPAPAWTADLQPAVGQTIPQTPVIPAATAQDLPPGVFPAATQNVVIDSGVIALYAVSAGSVAVLCWLALGAWQVRRLRAAAAPAPTEILQLFKQLAQTSEKKVQLGVLADLPVPVAVGLSKPCILLPQTLVAQANREQLRSVLAHELAHVEHRDLWLLALLRSLMVLLWPHPLFWFLRRRVRLDQEILADAAAAALTSRGEYAEQLVTLARTATQIRLPRLASSVGLWEKPSQLKERITLLLDEKLTILRSCSRRWRVGTFVALVGVALGLSLVTLTPGETEAPLVEATEGTEHTEIEASETSATLIGRVVTREVNQPPLPAANVEITLQLQISPYSFEEVSFPLLNTSTDAEGIYRFESLPSGKFAVIANTRGWITRDNKYVEVSAGQITSAPDVVMTRGGRVRIQLVDDVSGKPMQFDEPKKGTLANPSRGPRPISRTIRFLSTLSDTVEFSEEGIAEIQVPAGKFAFSVSIPGKDSSTGWMAVDFMRIRDILESKKLPTYEVAEGQLMEIPVRIIRDRAQEQSVVVPPSVELEPTEKPTDTFVPATEPPEEAPSEPSVTDEVGRPPKLLYLAWQQGDPESKKWDDLTLWNLQGKTLDQVEAKAFLQRVGEPLNHQITEKSLHPLLLFFQVDESIPSPVTPMAITPKGKLITVASARSKPTEDINVAVLTTPSWQVAAWPKSVSLKLNYATENFRVLKTVDVVNDQPIEIADGVRWYLVPTKAREYDPQTGRLREVPGKTAGALEIREDIYHGLTNYTSRIFAKKRASQPNFAHSTINTMNGKDYIVEVSDAFDNADQIERVIFLSQRHAIVEIVNVPLRLDLLPNDDGQSAISPKNSDAYENGIFVPYPDVTPVR